ncbi:OmpA family protein [Rhizobium rhizogenes]|uniref:OmpA family protein n=1 Tax=Rhizobium rhizogenes TaxID=359 RepID=UPI001573A8DC|nr:OmpA family protein [Rhizobium rhizogenes]NTI22567.1 OmpA family protein [Rhizobium rhizogenes]QTG06136.1 OmpA family protein [Rhizobium rhizogenes]
MGKRSRLFASAAFPLLSLSLAFEPVAAAALRDQAIMPLSNDAGGSVAVNGGASFEVAQEQPQGGQSEEELRKHKKPGEAEQGEPQGQKHEAAPAQQGGAEPQHKAKEAQPEAAPQPQKHQPEATPPKAAEPQAAPKQQQEQPAEKPPAQKPQAQPEAKPQPKAIEPQAQEPAEPAPKPHKQPAEQQPTAQPEAKPQPKAAPETQQQGQPEQKQHQKPQGQPAEPAQQTAPAKQPAPAAQQPQAQQAQPETETQPAQKPYQKPQAQPAETAPQQKAPAQQPAEQQTAPAQQPAPAGQQPQGHKTQPETQAQPATEAAPGNQQGQKPGGDKTHGKPQQGQQGEQQPAGNAQQPAQKGEPQGQQSQQPNQAAPQTGKQPQPANETGAPAQGTATPVPANGTAQPNGAAQPGAETAVPASQPVSPQELERRKKIAENPAESKGPVILPVQNGAAVLDSDKDAARRGHRQGGQNPGGQGGAQAGQQGQVGQAPVGQGQAGQGQNARTPPPAAYTKPPTSDAEAQRAAGGQQQPPVKMEAVTSEQGRRMDGRPNFTAPGGTTVQTIINQDNRTIVNVDNNYVVRHDDTERFVRGGERPTYEQLPRDRYRETIDQPDGDRIITVRNRYGDIIQRSRVDADGREYVLFYSPELEQQPDHDDYFRDPGDSLPPMRLLIPLSQYIIDTGTERDSDYYDFLREPPVEPVERIYSVNEVRYSARIRDKVRRIDLDTITFATGSAEIPMSQASTLRGVADAIGQIIKKDPTETFLIEGHTDAVGSAESNLILSDQRAESVAKVLSDVYGVPPENLVTQGYGEQYLKVNTQGPEQENRRVTIRRITALVRPVASNR